MKKNKIVNQTPKSEMNYEYQSEMNDDDDPYEYQPEEFTLFPTEGKYIINAFTGKPTKYLVGSKFEALFWKVLNSSLSSYNPIPKKFMGSSRGGSTYFFSSPEDYERIHEKTLDENIKIAWKQKHLRVKNEK